MSDFINFNIRYVVKYTYRVNKKIYEDTEIFFSYKDESNGNRQSRAKSQIAKKHRVATLRVTITSMRKKKRRFRLRR